MPRHRRQADVEGLRNLVHGRFPLGEPRKNGPPRRIRERREGDGKGIGHYLTHYEINTVAKYTATANLSSRPQSMTSGGVTSPTIATSPLSSGRNHVLFRDRSRTLWIPFSDTDGDVAPDLSPEPSGISAPGLREQCPICANAAPLWRRGIRPSTSGDRRDVMLTLRTLAIVIAGAGMFAGLPLTPAQACDDDRYPCPIRVPQEVDAPAQAAPSAQP